MTEECRELMEGVKEYIDAHACESLTIKELALRFGLCRNKFVKGHNYSPVQGQNYSPPVLML